MMKWLHEAWGGGVDGIGAGGGAAREHAAEPSGAELPAGQGLQATARASLEYEFAGQALQAVAAVSRP